MSPQAVLGVAVLALWSVGVGCASGPAYRLSEADKHDRIKRGEQRVTDLRKSALELADSDPKKAAAMAFKAGLLASHRLKSIQQWGDLGFDYRTSPRSPIVVGKVTPGGPADRAGIRMGDRVVRVDGIQTYAFSQTQAAYVLGGQSRSPVKLIVERGRSGTLEQSMELVVKRSAAVGINPRTSRPKPSK